MRSRVRSEASLRSFVARSGSRGRGLCSRSCEAGSRRYSPHCPGSRRTDFAEARSLSFPIQYELSEVKGKSGGCFMDQHRFRPSSNACPSEQSCVFVLPIRSSSLLIGRLQSKHHPTFRSSDAIHVSSMSRILEGNWIGAILSFIGTPSSRPTLHSRGLRFSGPTIQLLDYRIRSGQKPFHCFSVESRDLE